MKQKIDLMSPKREDDRMDFFATIEKRRSCRKFRPDPFPEEWVRKALGSAILAPNSSNTQTWHFHWVKSESARAELAKACLSQSAARTAAHLIVVTANADLWQRSRPHLVQWSKDVGAHKSVQDYYEKLVPWMYRAGWLNLLAPLRWLMFNGAGLFRPMMRTPVTQRDLSEVAIKSAALAAENFVLAITAQGGATCMMEGFDEVRVRRRLGLKGRTRVVMVIGVGFEDPKGLWGPRFRLPLSDVVTEHY
jgi:nitroreductase